MYGAANMPRTNAAPIEKDGAVLNKEGADSMAWGLLLQAGSVRAFLVFQYFFFCSRLQFPGVLDPGGQQPDGHVVGFKK